MSEFEILSLAFALGLDAFSVGIVVGTKSAKPRQLFRLSWHFGLFQFFMPILGWGFGSSLFLFIGQWNQWIAFIILFIIGLKMIREAMSSPKSHKTENIDRTRGWSLIALSIATSIDAFGAGVGLGVLQVNLLHSCLVIGIVTGLMTLIAMKLGNKLNSIIPNRIEIVGGVVLIGIAVKMIL